MSWPAELEGTVDLGFEHYLRWDGDGRGFLWHHPQCRPWASLSFDPAHCTGHALQSGGPEDMDHFTVLGSLLCPMGCGDHGFILNGRWRPA